VTDLHVVFDSWGMPLVFLIAFAEFAGFPVAGVPLLLVAGALAKVQGVSVLGLIVLAVIGGLLADYIWFRYARQYPAYVVDMACGLSSNPSACTTHVQRRVVSYGTRYIAIAKILPRSSNLIAAAAGLAEVRGTVFLALDALGLVLWSTLVLGTGWLLASPIDRVIGRLSPVMPFVVGVLIVLVMAATMWRVHKVRVHTGMHVREGKGR